MEYRWKVSFFLNNFLPPFLAFFSYQGSRDCIVDCRYSCLKEKRKRFLKRTVLTVLFTKKKKVGLEFSFLLFFHYNEIFFHYNLSLSPHTGFFNFICFTIN